MLRRGRTSFEIAQEAILYNRQTIDLQDTINIHGAATIQHCNIEIINKAVPALEKGGHIICPINIRYTPNDVPVLGEFEQLEAEQYGSNKYILEDHLTGRHYLPWCFTNTLYPKDKPVK